MVFMFRYHGMEGARNVNNIASTHMPNRRHGGRRRIAYALRTHQLPHQELRKRRETK